MRALSPIPNPDLRSTRRTISVALRHRLTLLLGTAVLAAAPHARAQRNSSDLGLTYLQERTKFVGSGSDPYFMLRGAKIDFGYNFARHLGFVLSGTGLSTVNLRGSEDVEQVSLTGGGRYTWNWGHITPTAINRKAGVFVEGKVGYVVAFAGKYPVNGTVLDHASALTYLGGGGINLHVYSRFDLRPLELEYVRNQLPNGGTNVQNSLRLGAGINWHFGL